MTFGLRITGNSSPTRGDTSFQNDTDTTPSSITYRPLHNSMLTRENTGVPNLLFTEGPP